MSESEEQPKAVKLPTVWISKVVDGLKGHQEATLVFGPVALATFGLSWGVNPWFATGCPGGIYFLYCLRMVAHARHAERMAEIEVEKLEKSIGAKIRKRAQKAIEHVKAKNHEH